SRLNSAENVRRCLLIRHLSHGEDFRLNRCPGSVDHYTRKEGFNDLRTSGLLKAMQGITSLEEVNRVTKD
ncbi:hypothetical protein, partial [Pseudomonas aeruginosa]|uniref:hypothetical protein n=1 Tax=Pseudomonas aeruginosa TaxID=287 RepID=UPI001C8E6EB2